ncbi:poly(ADP-ribose) glycohydrolase isoform X2 [Sinocyclocheilus anshuiensis]|uniref:poly(ADP-ribose) glycohydrolase isoform X2 n=1 Tax=Sinocyclocheilus anshuiensis TaxID=1608454 RepID=UPI0007B98535|nr:PREDICTED: poly(ADP-ribose) glycohydrolase-like isoform X2 [Sinocyclocheilus anshuiensis]
MSDCEPLGKSARLLGSESPRHGTEDAENPQKTAAPCSDSSKLQKKRPMRDPRCSRTLDDWLLKPVVAQRSSHQHQHQHAEPAGSEQNSRKQECPESPVTSEKPRRTGSALVSDAAANTGTRQITSFFTEAPGKAACRRAAAAAGADGKAFSGDVTGLGVPVSDLRRAPGCSGPLPALKPTDSHTVLIRPGEVPEPYPSPDQLQDRWDDTHVKLPCSEHNLFPVDRTTLQSRWDLINKALSVPFSSAHDVKDAILKYNTGQAKGWNFTALNVYCKGLQASEAQQMFGELLPAMAQLALRAPSLLTQPIPLLRTQRCRSLTLSQEQVSCLLANAFFCTFPRRNSRRTEFSNYPDINFSRLFEGSSQSKQEKLKTLLWYFRRVTQQRPAGLITYTRQCVQRLPSWSSSEKQFSKLRISCDGSIEDQGYGMLQVDFANQFVGGGVTGSGLVQEEIRFLINPELIAARLFTEALDDNECLIITGAEQFSRYSGYSDTYRWDGNHDDQTPRDKWKRRCTEIVAIDALHYRNFLEQFHAEHMSRELNKAFCGFVRPGVQMENLSAVATGNWGCGAFGGDTRLKAVLQMMAAAEAERDLMYFTFGDADLLRDVHHIHTLITDAHATVGSLFSLLLQYYECVCKKTTRGKPQETLYCFLSERL